VTARISCFSSCLALIAERTFLAFSMSRSAQSRMPGHEIGPHGGKFESVPSRGAIKRTGTGLKSRIRDSIAVHEPDAQSEFYSIKLAV